MRNRKHSWRFRRTGRTSTELLVGVAVASAVASSFPLLSAYRRNNKATLDRLARAVGRHRVTRARLAGQFSYVPCTTSTSDQRLVTGLICTDSNPARWPESDQLQRLAVEMHARGSVRRDVAFRHFSGAWHILWGDP